MSTVVKDLGAVSAYAYAVEKGYTGTEAEFAELMASYAEVGQTAVDAAESALNSKTAAQTAATTATNKASEATTAAQTATTKAGEASHSASEANAAKEEAVTAQTAAETAQGKAEDAQAAAESVAESIPSDYSQLSADVSQIKEELNALPSIKDGDAENVDLDITDNQGNVIARLADGGIQTKNFNSALNARNWIGKKWTAIGDSLTEVNQRTTKHYHDYIAEATGINVVNLGHSGAGYYARPSDYCFRRRALQVETNSDVVTIFGSGNDVGKIPLGEVTDTEATTLCGCINITLDNIYATAPLVPLGVITPTPWYQQSGSKNWTPTNPDNDMELYSNAIVEICKRRSIPCLDLYHCSNLHPDIASFRTIQYSKDDGNGIHPDETGHYLIAARFQAFLDTLLLH